jgi:hypothetical protein
MFMLLLLLLHTRTRLKGKPEQQPVWLAVSNHTNHFCHISTRPRHQCDVLSAQDCMPVHRPWRTPITHQDTKLPASAHMWRFWHPTGKPATVAHTSSMRGSTITHRTLLRALYSSSPLFRGTCPLGCEVHISLIPFLARSADRRLPPWVSLLVDDTEKHNA